MNAIDIMCGAIVGCGATLLMTSILVGNRIQEERDKVWRCIFECKEYRREIRTLKRQKSELEKRIEDIKNFDYDFTNEEK